MPRFVAYIFRFSVLLIVATGCESSSDKLKRLEYDLMLARVDVSIWEKRNDGIPDKFPKVPNSMDSLIAARQRLTLAQREYNKFMSGR